MSTIVFVPLALNQARFYLSVSHALRGLGINAVLVSFHEPSIPAIRARGIPVLNFFDFLSPATEDVDQIVRRLADRYGMDNVNRLISHEKVTYEIRDSAYLIYKLARYVDATERVLNDVTAQFGPLQAMVQELGGFLSIVAGFYVARARGVTSVFIEPSFFRARVFFLMDSFAPPLIPRSSRDVSATVHQYLAEAARTQQILIPAKDVSHYRSAARKILSPYNLRRLVEKSVQKYVQMQREEFTHLGTQVRRHARMLMSDLRLRPYAQDLPTRPFVYYPLHVWTDVALTIRAPEYLDQYWLLDYLARNAPPSHLVAFKEHPAQVGGINDGRIRDLLRRHDNLVLLRPWINNYRILQAADAVVTVNSKSGAEAILLGKPVLTLGDSFYRASGLAAAPSSPTEIPAALRSLLASPPPTRAHIELFFQAVWDQSYPGELYLDEPDNVRVFAQSLVRFLGESRSAPWSPKPAPRDGRTRS